MRRLFFIVITSLLLIGCSKKKEKMSSEAEVNLIKQCLVMLEKKGRKGYVVSPQFQKFNLNSFLREEDSKYGHDMNKTEILNSLKWTDKDFTQIMSEVDNSYSNRKNIELTKLSKVPINNEVIYFSGIHKNLIFASIVNYCNAVKTSELESNLFNKQQRFSSAMDYAFIIKNGIVIDMIIDGGVVKEIQCNQNDVQVDENGKVIETNYDE